MRIYITKEKMQAILSHTGSAGSESVAIEPIGPGTIRIFAHAYSRVIVVDGRPEDFGTATAAEPVMPEKPHLVRAAALRSACGFCQPGHLLVLMPEAIHVIDALCGLPPAAIFPYASREFSELAGEQMLKRAIANAKMEKWTPHFCPPVDGHFVRTAAIALADLTGAMHQHVRMFGSGIEGPVVVVPAHKAEGGIKAFVVIMPVRISGGSEIKDAHPLLAEILGQKGQEGR